LRRFLSGCSRPVGTIEACPTNRSGSGSIGTIRSSCRDYAASGARKRALGADCTGSHRSLSCRHSGGNACSIGIVRKVRFRRAFYLVHRGNDTTDGAFQIPHLAEYVRH
jgi:hypothetical protein